MNLHKAFIDIQNLSKVIKKRHLLFPINYKLSQGKILALCGGNGAGKSTLIRLITGILKPTTGQVTINQLMKEQHSTNHIGYMPDDFKFQNSLTTKETISFYASIKKVNQQHFEEALKTVGLQDQLHERVGNFSKGMTQRLLFAQALLAKPNLLILDEPTNGLDPYWIKQFSQIILQAKNNGQTIIFSTHDLHVAEQIADEVIFLNKGKVISAGAVSEYVNIGLHETFQQLYFESIQPSISNQ